MLYTCDKLYEYVGEPQNRQECRPTSYLLLHLWVERVEKENEPQDESAMKKINKNESEEEEEKKNCRSPFSQDEREFKKWHDEGNSKEEKKTRLTMWSI